MSIEIILSIFAIFFFLFLFGLLDLIFDWIVGYFQKFDKLLVEEIKKRYRNVTLLRKTLLISCHYCGKAYLLYRIGSFFGTSTNYRICTNIECLFTEYLSIGADFNDWIEIKGSKRKNNDENMTARLKRYREQS